ncbi:MAG TPA: DinB family protein [Acidimicrobiales bacterium]|jgi:hypothetical protein
MVNDRDQRDRLIGFLDAQREHVLGILEDLNDEQLRRAVLPSGWSCLGLVKHLALDVEHYWARCIVAGEALTFFTENSLDEGGAWRVGADETADEIFSLYRAEWARSNEIITETTLDQPPAISEEWWGDWKVADVGFIVLHMIEETACHAGHLDVVRELFDGRRWMAFNPEVSPGVAERDPASDQ